MSKRTFFKRYIWLYDSIKNKPYITFDELQNSYNSSILWKDETGGFSKRTFHRDINEIEELFDIEISYDNSKRGYYTEDDVLSKNALFLIESYRVIRSLGNFKTVGKYISTGFHNTGSEHLSSILYAIKNRIAIEFSYYKHVGGELSKREIDPYFIKEFKFRWYVIGKDHKDKQIKTFALERILTNSLTASPNTSYQIPEDINPDSFFDDSFGIFKLQDAKPEIVELSVSPLKGQFIKSVPLHKSQTVLVDNKTELRIQLRLQITHDFIMEILSHGSDVIVIKPKELAEKIKEELTKSLERYN